MDPFNRNKSLLREKVKKLREGKRPRLVVVRSKITQDKDTQDKGTISIKDDTKITIVKPEISAKSKPRPIIDFGDESVLSGDGSTKSVIETKHRSRSKKSISKIQSFNDSITKEEPTREKTFINDDIDFFPDLNNDFKIIDDIVKSSTSKFYIYNVCYTINYNSMKPYIMYYTYKYPKSEDPKTNELIIFPFSSYKNTQGNNVLTQSSSMLNNIFSSKQREAINYKSKGYIYNEQNKQIFIFYEYDSIKQPRNIEKLSRKTQFWWALIDELVNYKRVLNFSVSSIVSNLFLDNPSLLYLHNRETSEQIEIPSVGYHGAFYDLLPLIVSFGLKASTLYPMMGKYYYFGTFRKAVRYAAWTSTYKPRKFRDVVIADDNGLYQRGGIVRFAIFLGNMHAFLNHPYDRDDYSERYYNRIASNPIDKQYEDLTLKLHDHDGKWAQKYDSVYVGRAKLSNGGLFMKNPEFITRKFEQQNILSYHELDKKTLYYDERRKTYKWKPDYKYYNII